MKTSKTYLLGAAGAFLFAATAAYGDIANGTYTFTAPDTAPIWDISGSYSGTLDPIDLDVTITENSSGILSGSGTFGADIDGILFSGNATVTGKVSGSSAKTGVAMDLVLSGTGTIGSDNADFAAKGKTLFAVVGVSNELSLISGSASATVTDTVTGKKKGLSGKIGTGEGLNLPSGDTGGWNLTLNVTPDGTKLTGTATVQTSAGGTATLTATGTYSSKTDTSKVTLKGSGGSLSLVIATSGPSMTVESMKGKLFGQSISLKAP